MTDAEMEAALRTWQQLARAKQAEVERLRAKLQAEREMRHVGERQRDEARAEVERLRAESAYNFREAEKVPGLQAEVERLRDIEMKYDILDRDVKERWTPEVERLRAIEEAARGYIFGEPTPPNAYAQLRAALGKDRVIIGTQIEGIIQHAEEKE
jgi:hypothetical protein